MALSQEFLDELHDRSDVVDVIGSYVQLRQRGRLYTGLCPFHSEKTPSFTVYPNTQSYYCFGCGNGGDVITFIKNYENLDYMDAVRLLADRAGMQMPEDSTQDDSYRKKRILEANRQAAKFYFKNLNSESGREARKYLRRRGLSDETITRFGIGYAPDDWGLLRDYLISKGFKESELVDASLCTIGRNGKPYDFFRARVMFPVIDVRGQVVAFSGRTMGSDTRKYVNTKDTPVFKKSKILFGMNLAKNAGTRRVILVEGQMDVITLHQAGFTDAVATLGTAITDEHALMLSRYVDEVLISYDADEAGQKATRRAIDTLRAAGIPTRVIQLEGGKDPDEIIREKGSSAFKSALDKASGSIEYELLRAQRNVDIETPDGKVEYLKQASSILSRCQSITEREVWAAQVASLTGVDKQTIMTSAERVRKQQRASDRKKLDQKLPSSVVDRLNLKIYERDKVGSVAAERRIVAALILNPDFAKKCKERLSGRDFVSDEVGGIYDAVITQIENGEFSGLSSLAAVLSDKQMALASGTIAESNGINYSAEDTDFFIDKIIEHKERSKLEVRSADANTLMQSLKNKKQ
ncbi:MAG: DNA primase [Oscillospiraceae bacterium]|nr:DNA primase [Oscillospiraceae bacterium]